MKTCIIGAGIAGITLGKSLKGSLILEKSKGVGGRIASRRIMNRPLEHGAQSFFHPELNQQITSPHQWIKEEAKELLILNSWEAVRFEKKHGIWKIHSTGGDQVECERIILTSPAPQSLKLLKNSGLNADFLEAVKYRSEIQFMICDSSEKISKLNFENYFLPVFNHSLQDGMGLSLFSMNNKYVEHFLDLSKEEIKELFIKKFTLSPLETHVHIWRYAETIRAISSEHQDFFKETNIYLAGDYFDSSGINGSLASAHHLLRRL